jgi:protein-S-isoprenylcysteine O-methyltransferase Ste14
MAASRPSDKPGVIAFPGVLYAAAFALAFGLHLMWPVNVLPSPLAQWAGVALCLAGAALILWGIAAMRGAKTNIYPELPATALVVSGPFRFTRNPLYGALAILFVGLCLEVNMAWGFVVLVPLLLVMHYGVILREERYLESKFGESYRQYRSTVRRYL